MRSDVYVTVRRHRPLRPVDVLNPVMMTFWVARFVLWLVMVGFVFMTLTAVVMVVAAWKLGTLGVRWLVARIEDKPKPAPPDWRSIRVDETNWVGPDPTAPDWTHAEVLASLKPEIAAQFREEPVISVNSRHEGIRYSDGAPVRMDVDSTGRVYVHPRIG